VSKPWENPSTKTIRETMADNMALGAALNEISLLAYRNNLDITHILKKYGIKYVEGVDSGSSSPA